MGREQCLQELGEASSYHFECEEIFFNSPYFVSADVEHSVGDEKRYLALGFTDRGRYLFVAFTMRETQIRAISFRDMTEKERKIYEHHEKK